MSAMSNFVKFSTYSSLVDSDTFLESGVRPSRFQRVGLR